MRNISPRRPLTCSNCVAQFHQSQHTAGMGRCLSAGRSRNSSPDTLRLQPSRSPDHGKTLHPLGNSRLALETKGKQCLQMSFTRADCVFWVLSGGFTNFAEASAVAFRAGTLEAGAFTTLHAGATIEARIRPAGRGCVPPKKTTDE